MSSISGIGGSGNIPQKPPQQPEADLKQLDAIKAFNNLVSELTSLASEAKLGRNSHG